LGAQAGLLPDALLNLNLGQVQAVINGYSDRIVDETCQCVWNGYYAAYFFSKHPKKPTEIIKQLLQENSKGDSYGGNSKADVDMEAELELFAQRDLRLFEMMGGNSNVN